METNTTRGFTLIELLITLAIAVILISFASPTYTKYISETKIVGAAEKIKTDMDWARTRAIRSNSNIIAKFQSNSTNWCYGFDDLDDDCDCTLDSCTVNNVLQTNSGQSYNGTKLNITFANGTEILTLTKRGITESVGKLILSSGKNTVQISINQLGRANICSDQLSNYPDCIKPGPIK